MFVDSLTGAVLRSASAVPVQSQTSGVSICNTRAKSAWIIATVAARTVGNVSISVQDSPDGSTGWTAIGSSFSLNVSANGLFYIVISVPVGPFIRVDLNPGGGFDGTVQLTLRTDGQVAPASG